MSENIEQRSSATDTAEKANLILRCAESLIQRVDEQDPSAKVILEAAGIQLMQVQEPLTGKNAAEKKVLCIQNGTQRTEVELEKSSYGSVVLRITSIDQSQQGGEQDEMSASYQNDYPKKVIFAKPASQHAPYPLLDIGYFYDASDADGVKAYADKLDMRPQKVYKEATKILGQIESHIDEITDSKDA